MATRLAREMKPPSSQHTSSPVRIIQMNCFAHAYCLTESTETYRGRMESLKAHILELKPSIVVLEEIDNADTAPEGYSLPADVIGTCSTLAGEGWPDYQGINGQKQQSGKDQTWVLFDTNVLNLLQGFVIEMPNGANQFAILCVFEEKRKKSSLGRTAGAQRNQQGDKEEEISNGTPFALVAMHCKAGRTEDSESLRIAHSKYLLTELVKRAPELIGQHHRLIWAGDFNAGPHSYGGQYPSRWYEQVIESRKSVKACQDDHQEDAKDDDQWTNTLIPLVSAYVSLQGAEPELTTYKVREGKLIAQTIDYIFVARQGGFTVNAVLAMPSLTDGGLPETLPTLPFWGSDHLSVCVDITV